MASERYLVLAEALKREILDLGPSSRLATERELQQRFGVSRTTVRRALEMLERGGLVSRERRRGTSVSPPKVVRSLSPLYSIEEDLRRQGVKSEPRLLRYDPAIEPPELVRAALRLDPDSPVGRLELLRVVEDRVIGYDRRYFPPTIAARFDPLLVGDRSITETVSELVGSPISATDAEIDIDGSEPEVARTLGITPGMLIVTVTGTHFLDDGSPVQVVVLSYRVDRVRFRSSVRYAHDAAQRR